MARVPGFKPLAAARPRHKARICYVMLAIIVGTALFLLPAEKIKVQVAAPAKLQVRTCGALRWLWPIGGLQYSTAC